MNGLIHVVALLGMAAFGGVHTDAAPTHLLQAPSGAIEAWRNMRFGMFIHWGPASLTGGELSWSRGREGTDVRSIEVKRTLHSIETW